MDRFDILFGDHGTPHYSVSLGESTDETIQESISDYWISIDDRLPKSKGHYLVCDLLEKDSHPMRVSYFDKHNFDWACTHWMPLPKLPEDEK